jgi:hypothetical protein
MEDPSAPTRNEPTIGIEEIVETSLGHLSVANLGTIP